MNISIHPAANVFPMMEGVAREQLKEDIRVNGQRDAITIFENQILDGRNRYACCVELGIVPRYEAWDGKGEIVAFVVSRNLHRRHLNASQKACASLLITAEIEKSAKERMLAGHSADPAVKGTTNGIAGQLMGCSGNYVLVAKRLFKKDRALFDRVWRGEIKLHPALRILGDSKEYRAGTRIVLIDLRSGLSKSRRIFDVPMDDVDSKIKAFYP